MRLPALGLFAATVAVVASLGGGAPGAPVPKHLMKDGDTGLEPLQGQWKLTRVEFAGQPVPPAAMDVVLEFRGGELRTVSEQQNRRTTTAVKLDPKAAQLGWDGATLTDLKGQPLKDPESEKPCAMRYKLDGDALVLAVNIGGDRAQAPKGFGGKDEPGVVTMTFTRVKK